MPFVFKEVEMKVWLLSNYLSGLFFFIQLVASDLKWTKKEARMILAFPLWGCVAIPTLLIVYFWLVLKPRLISLIKVAK